MMVKINKYIGNGAYCYANSTSMMLDYLGENIFPSKVEVLTGVGLSASLKKTTGVLYFNNQTLFPDLGISKALEILGFTYKSKVSKTEKDFPIEIIRKDLAKMPAILGPVDMGYLSYNPNHQCLKGADHYVFVYKMDNNEIFLHDPAGFPFVSLSIQNLKKAWKANGIGYKKGYYRYITAVKRINSPTEGELYNTAVNYFKNLYKEGQKETSKKIWLVGKEAILHVVEKIKKNGLAKNEIGHFVYFALPLGAKRALDFASFFAKNDPNLAQLKQEQAKLFGEAQTRCVKKNWILLAKALEKLAEVEEDFRNELLGKGRI